MLACMKSNSKPLQSAFFAIVVFVLVVSNLAQANNYDYASEDLYSEIKADLRIEYGIKDQNLELITPNLWDVFDGLLLARESRPIFADPWDLISTDIQGESGLAVLVMYDNVFECENLPTGSNAWFMMRFWNMPLQFL